MTLPLWALVAVYIAAALVFAAGLWMLKGGRRSDDAAVPPVSAPARWRSQLSKASRTAIGLGLIFLAYHAAAYTSPKSWMILKVPQDLWWVVVLGVAVLIGGSLLADKLEQSGKSSGGG